MDDRSNSVKDEHIDPVCAMTVTGDAAFQLEHMGERYYFCSEHCLREFNAHPELYLGKKAPPVH
jgi:Cu+-exporting ATPase